MSILHPFILKSNCNFLVQGCNSTDLELYWVSGMPRSYLMVQIPKGGYLCVQVSGPINLRPEPEKRRTLTVWPKVRSIHIISWSEEPIGFQSQKYGGSAGYYFYLNYISYTVQCDANRHTCFIPVSCQVGSFQVSINNWQMY